jgi:hypothetical protein
MILGYTGTILDTIPVYEKLMFLPSSKVNYIPCIRCISNFAAKEKKWISI